MCTIDRLVEEKLESILRLWANNGCYFQDFIDACSKHGADIKHLGTQQISPSKDMVYVLCVPKGQSMPVCRLTAIKE